MKFSGGFEAYVYFIWFNKKQLFCLGCKVTRKPWLLFKLLLRWFSEMLDVPDSYMEIQSFFLNAKLHLF